MSKRQTMQTKTTRAALVTAVAAGALAFAMLTSAGGCGRSNRSAEVLSQARSAFPSNAQLVYHGRFDNGTANFALPPGAGTVYIVDVRRGEMVYAEYLPQSSELRDRPLGNVTQPGRLYSVFYAAE